MAKKNSRNNELLNKVRENTSPKIYGIILKLVNEDREDLAEIVVKIDYLLEYTSKCIKHKDYEEARESLDKAKDRIEKLKKESIDVEYLEYLYEGIYIKCK